MTMNRFDGRTAIVTGAGSGIGRAIAERLHAEGASILAVDRNPEATALLAGLPRVTAMQCDVTAADSPQRIVETCLARHGRLDVLVNNAGLGSSPPFRDTTDADFDRWIDANLRSTFRLTRAAVSELLTRKGVILNIASGMGLRGFPGQSAYSTAKAGVIGFTRNLAANHAREGLRANAIAPGLIATPATVARLDEPRFHAAVVGTTPMGRYGRAGEVAAAAAFLCSDDASFVTGQVLCVDGGQTESTYVCEEILQCWESAQSQ